MDIIWVASYKKKKLLYPVFNGYSFLKKNENLSNN